MNIRPFAIIGAVSLLSILACDNDDEDIAGPSKTDTVTVVEIDTLRETDTLRLYDTTEVSEFGKPLDIRFYPLFGTEALELGKRYKNAGDDTVTLTLARFYVSEFALVDTLGQIHPSPGLDMVDFSDTARFQDGYFTVRIKALPGKYRGVKFSVGVPYSLNHQDVATQRPPLGPNSEMFWTWNSGYIFNRIEGKVDSSGTLKNWFYHIGADNRKLNVGIYNLPNPYDPTATLTALDIGASGNVFSVNVDYAELFTRGLAPTGPIQAAADTTERMAHGGPLADRVFLNTQTMFSLKN